MGWSGACVKYGGFSRTTVRSLQVELEDDLITQWQIPSSDKTTAGLSGVNVAWNLAFRLAIHELKTTVQTDDMNK